MINHKIKKPKANADRFTKMPKNRQKEKNPSNLTKYPSTYLRSEKMILSSSNEEYARPKASEITNRNTVETAAKAKTVRNFE